MKSSKNCSPRLLASTCFRRLANLNQQADTTRIPSALFKESHKFLHSKAVDDLSLRLILDPSPLPRKPKIYVGEPVFVEMVLLAGPLALDRLLEFVDLVERITRKVGRERRKDIVSLFAILTSASLFVARRSPCCLRNGCSGIEPTSRNQVRLSWSAFAYCDITNNASRSRFASHRPHRSLHYTQGF